MKHPLPRWITYASLAAVLVFAVTGARAFTDSNAELKEAATDRTARVLSAGRTVPPVQTAWVPVSAKRLDGFKPVLPLERSTALAKAEVPASAGR